MTRYIYGSIHQFVNRPESVCADVPNIFIFSAKSANTSELAHTNLLIAKFNKNYNFDELFSFVVLRGTQKWNKSKSSRVCIMLANI